MLSDASDANVRSYLLARQRDLDDKLDGIVDAIVAFEDALAQATRASDALSHEVATTRDATRDASDMLTREIQATRAATNDKTSAARFASRFMALLLATNFIWASDVRNIYFDGIERYWPIVTALGVVLFGLTYFVNVDRRNGDNKETKT